jgi:hypothetical protein
MQVSLKGEFTQRGLYVHNVLITSGCWYHKLCTRIEEEEEEKALCELSASLFRGVRNQMCEQTPLFMPDITNFVSLCVGIQGYI